MMLVRHLARMLVVIAAFSAGLWFVWLYVLLGDWQNLATGFGLIALSLLFAGPPK